MDNKTKENHEVLDCCCCGEKPIYLFDPDLKEPHIITENCGKDMLCLGQYQTRKKTRLEAVKDWNRHQQEIKAALDPISEEIKEVEATGKINPNL